MEDLILRELNEHKGETLLALQKLTVLYNRLRLGDITETELLRSIQSICLTLGKLV